LAPITSFDDVVSVTALVNHLPYGLAAYVMTRSLARAAAMSETLESGMVGINHFSVSTPASPFGGVKESGYGSEGGIEGLDAYLVVKTITQRISGSDLQPN
jgi:succinate-semialdehyde dehydrogenase/glutarate-semialdehyde dehydrogenase